MVSLSHSLAAKKAGVKHAPATVRKATQKPGKAQPAAVKKNVAPVAGVEKNVSQF